MVDATNPFLPTPVYKMTSAGVKVARPDITLQDESLPSDVMEDLIFDEIGGEEILSVSRSDLITSPFDNVYTLKPIQKNVIPLSVPQSTMQGSLLEYVPTTSNVISPSGTNYATELDGSIIINLVNVDPTQKVEVQIYGGGSFYNDTIY